MSEPRAVTYAGLRYRLPATLVEMRMERIAVTDPRYATLKRNRLFAVSQLIDDAWRALNAKYYQPRAAIAALLPRLTYRVEVSVAPEEEEETCSS